ncbi:pilus assembly protein TadG-related protein [Asticcacaulis sp. DXS10W]|uniref:Pilus assembly protein TadG-related protein n=1 Tax=Asticcacaulis currens TaxID=2984210 RepID=A0ABT5IHU3_9CAUL|nr:pilus assembly protein TadG-related protein [Asticcacaulis currens]MDC7695458.1 pilus assembly protein TadG-related protein [Asticcacaulis currens]
MRLPAFLLDRRGNTAVMFGLFVFVLAAAVAGAVDFSNVVSRRSKAQDALDAATLAVAILRPTTVDQAKAAVTLRLKQELGDNPDGVQIDQFNYDTTTRTYYVTAKGTYKPYLLGVVNITALPYQVLSKTVQAANGTLELSLVLDNTDSMGQALDGTKTRLDVLKTAATNLVNTVMTTANKDYVKVAIVPYADYVNVGLANRGQTWISVGADYTVPAAAQKCNTISTKQVCTGGVWGTCDSIKDGVPIKVGCWKTPQTCTTVNITPYQSCDNPQPTYYKWYGCVRHQVDSKTKLLIMPDPLTAYTGVLETAQRCPTAIQPLSNDKTVVTNAINGLVNKIGSYQPDTFIPGGLVWGVNTLSPPAPFKEGQAYDAKNKEPKKVIVLMTDGANTLYTNASGQTVSAATGSPPTISTSLITPTYTVQANVCNYAKGKNIEIFVIGLGVTDATALASLKSCATDAQHYFDAQNANDLINAFEVIGGKLSVVRLMQ